MQPAEFCPIYHHVFFVVVLLIVCRSKKAIRPKMETNQFSVLINVSYVNLVRVSEMDR